MITLHTFENNYDDGSQYHQFLQRGRQHLLDSTAVGQEETLRHFLEHSIIGDCLDPSCLDDRVEARLTKLLTSIMEAGDIPKLLDYAERIDKRDMPGELQPTRFGDWSYDSIVIDPPSLRELQEDPWDYDPEFPYTDWKYEVAEDNTTLGYWEWVESQKEQAENE